MKKNESATRKAVLSTMSQWGDIVNGASSVELKIQKVARNGAKSANYVRIGKLWYHVWVTSSSE